jgi:hypothetical protein
MRPPCLVEDLHLLCYCCHLMTSPVVLLCYCVATVLSRRDEDIPIARWRGSCRQCLKCGGPHIKAASPPPSQCSLSSHHVQSTISLKFHSLRSLHPFTTFTASSTHSLRSRGPLSHEPANHNSAMVTAFYLKKIY